MRKSGSFTEEPAVRVFALWGKPFPKGLEIPLVSRAVYGKEDRIEIKAIPFLHQYPVKIRGHLVRGIPKYAAAPGAQGQSPDTLCHCQGQDASYALYPPAADFLFIHFSCRSPKVYGRRRDDSGLAGWPEKSTVGASEDFYERRKDHAARAVHTLAPPVLLIIGKSLFP